MAITFVNAGASVSANSPTVGLPTGWAQGDFFVIGFISGSSTFTPSGWTSIGATSGAGLYIFVKTAGFSESAPTLSGGGGTACMLAYRNAFGLNAVGTAQSTNSSTMTTLSLTTSIPNCFILSIYGTSSGVSRTLSTPGGTTSRRNVSPTISWGGLLMVDEAQSSAGASISRSSTITGGALVWVSRAIAIWPANDIAGDFFQFM